MPVDGSRSISFNGDGHGGWLSEREIYCAELRGKAWQFKEPISPGLGESTLDLTVWDATGLIENVDNHLPEGVVMPPLDPEVGAAQRDGHPQELLISWVGGACDASADVTFAEATTTGRYRIIVTTTPVDPVAPCVMVAILHGMTLDATTQIDPADVEPPVRG